MAVSPDWRIDRISLTTADPDPLAAFYCTALGFARAGEAAFGGGEFARVMGLPDARAEAVVLSLGGQSIELLAFAQQGRPYPAGSTSADLAFQHMAIVVSDMRAAYARLALHGGWTPISTGGPQRLPATSGGVTAFKFRDPEGHPLELLEFPQQATPDVWTMRHEPDPCLGIDHSAISVSDTAASAGFYGQFGFRILGRSLNSGPPQQRLDGLNDAEVQVTALGQPGAVPHLELLCYRSSRSCGLVRPCHASNDVSATRLVLRSSQQTGHPATPASWTRVERLEDPDGHHVLVWH
jgi:catechol 2,3-dioxygenase-like lactoylglutathione lyase family enzyme